MVHDKVATGEVVPIIIILEGDGVFGEASGSGRIRPLEVSSGMERIGKVGLTACCSISQTVQSLESWGRRKVPDQLSQTRLTIGPYAVPNPDWYTLHFCCSPHS